MSLIDFGLMKFDCSMFYLMVRSLLACALHYNEVPLYVHLMVVTLTVLAGEGPLCGRLRGGVPHRQRQGLAQVPGLHDWDEGAAGGHQLQWAGSRPLERQWQYIVCVHGREGGVRCQAWELYANRRIYAPPMPPILPNHFVSTPLSKLTYFGKFWLIVSSPWQTW